MCTKALSLPLWVIFVSSIVLLFYRTNKPIKICLLRIFLENSRGPSKKVFILIARGANKQEILWRAVEQIFKSPRPFFLYYHRKLFFWTSKRKGDTSLNFHVASKRIKMVYKVIKPASKERKVSFDAEKTRRPLAFSFALNTNYRPRDLENKMVM